MATAGYDPRAATDLWELMSAVEADNAAKGQTSIENRFALLRTHPTSDERYAALEKDMEGALSIWKDHMATYWRGVEVKREKAKKEQQERQHHGGDGATKAIDEVAVA